MLSKYIGVGHFFSTRFGGVSGREGNLFNASFGKESAENAGNVIENLRRASEAAGFDVGRVTALKQVHGDRVVKVTEEVAGARFGKPDMIIEGDALITDLCGTPLLTTHGDCVPVFLYAPGKAVGLAHSGWRGSLADVAGKTVDAMKREFGVRPEEVVAAIGPFICRDCFEVDLDVAELFDKRFGDKGLVTFDPKKNKYHIDLGKAVVISLSESGVRRENISLPGVCTACGKNRELFFSYRGEKGLNEGLMCAVIWRKNC